MTAEEIRKKIDDLTRRTEAANTKRAEIAGQLQAKKTELMNLIAEIKEAGYDPKNLVEARNQAQQQLEKTIATYEKDLAQVEEALAKF